MLFLIFTLEDAMVKEMVSDLHLILNEFWLISVNKMFKVNNSQNEFWLI